MNAYYNITTELKTLLLEDEDVNTVTKGDPTKLDLDKKNIFPLAHIAVNSANPIGGDIGTSMFRFNVSIFAMDLRNTNKTIRTDKFIGNDNEDDNLNSMLYVLTRLYLRLTKFKEEWEVNSTDAFEPFTEARHNVVDGWVMNINIDVPIGDITAC